MKKTLFAVFCLLLLSQGLLAQAPAPAAPAPSCPVNALPFLTPEPSAAVCTVNQCRNNCPNCPGCVKDCIDFATCKCECFCS
jgi:hypothetical protein